MSQGVTKNFFWTKLIFMDYIFKNNIKDLKKKIPKPFYAKNSIIFITYYQKQRFGLWENNLREQFHCKLPKADKADENSNDEDKQESYELYLKAF